jgi:integrase
MGTMRERAQGTWELSVAAGRDPDTGAYRRVIRTVKGLSKREAKAALAELEVAVAAGRVGADDPTLAELLERWMEHIAGLGRSDSTLYNYRKYIDREIVPALGSNRLSKLSPLDIDRFYTKLRKRGLSSSTIRQMHAILRASLNQAERWGLVHRNVAKLASAPSQEQREQLPPEPAMVRALLVAAREFDPLFGLYVRIAVAIGARRAEVCGLRWSDIDLDAGSLSVQRSYLAIPGAKGDRPTKTRSARTVSLDPDTIAALEAGWSTAVRIAELVGMTEAERRQLYVFSTDPLGRNAWRPDVASAKWEVARSRVPGGESVRLHDLRHFQATLLLDAGVPVPTVAARLGHADGTTTMKIYAHRTRRADEHAARVVANFLAEPD